MATDVLPACVDALIAGIRSVLVPSPLAEGSVIDGWPSLGDLPNECVIVGGTQAESEEWALLGRLGRNQEFELELIVRAHVSGDSQKAARDRAYSFLAAIETWLRTTNTNMNVAGVYDAQLVRPLYTPFPTDEGLAVQLAAGVRIRARI